MPGGRSGKQELHRVERPGDGPLDKGDDQLALDVTGWLDLIVSVGLVLNVQKEED